MKFFENIKRALSYSLKIFLLLISILILSYLAYATYKIIPIINSEPILKKFSLDGSWFNASIKMRFTYKENIFYYLNNDYGNVDIKFKIILKNKKAIKHVTLQLLDKEGFVVDEIKCYEKDWLYPYNEKDYLVKIIDKNKILGYELNNISIYLSKKEFNSISNFSFTYQDQ